MIATTKNTSGSPWWEKYNPETQSLSSFWLEVSRGTFHVVSPSPTGVGAFSVVLPYEASHYDSLGNQAEQQINKDIWIDLHRQGLTDWTPYDKWRFNNTDGLFYNERDSIVDFIYKIHRSRGIGGMPNVAGFNQLSWNGGNGLVDTINNISANYGPGTSGSGITVSFKGLKDQYIGAATHEHDHYLSLDGHIQNSKAAYGIGLDNFYSPYDMILNNYMSPTNANLNTTNYLGDFSSRNSGSGNIIKVPIEGEQFFLLANRNKVSKWDRVMLGDTAQIHPFDDNSDYGKGLYIYHIKNGIHFSEATNDTVQDLECADGYWEWEFKGYTYGREIYNCYKSPNPTYRYYKRKTVLYTNDPSTLGEFDGVGTNYGNPNPWGDGVSFFYRVGYTPWHASWDIGVESQDLCGIGLNRIFSTENHQLYQNTDNAGDRYDAWHPGYNEMFSPYSSPSTVKWNNDSSNIFIYFKGYDNSGNAKIDIYKADATMPLWSILEATPPSRPMGLTLDTCFDAGNGISYIKLNWVHNMEPDMERGSKEKYKRYKIFRSFSTNAATVPPDSYLYPENHYNVIDTVDINSNVAPSYVDSVNNPKIYSVCTYLPDGSCPPICYNLVNVRYRVQAVDMYDSVSRLSDFDQCQGYRRDSVGGIPIGSGEDFLPHKGNASDKIIPNEFKLFQNFPNPFNPNTNISYDIPIDCFVTIKIYDVSGREIKSLVNEFIKAGNYITGFNGSGLASGIYFYKITAGSFVQTKRMVLIK